MPLQEVGNPQSHRRRGAFLAWWVFGTFLGWILAVITILFLIDALMPDGKVQSGEDFISLFFPVSLYFFILPIALPTLGGLLATCLQWVIMRVYMRQSVTWIILSAIAWVLPPFIIILPVGGVTSAFLQWFLMRKKVPRSAWWILASGGSWTLATAAVVLVVFGLAPDGIVPSSDPTTLTLLLGSLSLIPGTITGIMMSTLISRPLSPITEPGAA